MNLRTLIQNQLDDILLPEGIMSHHLRRVKVDAISGTSAASVNNDEYVVYRVVSGKNRAYGDGKPQAVQQYIDVNYYYSYDKNDARFIAADTRIKAIIKEFTADKRFRLANGQSDLYDIDNPYRGINIEFLFVGVIDNA